MSPSSPPSVVANGSNVKYIDDIDASKDPQMANSEQIGSLPRPSFSNILVQLLHGKLPDDARRIELQNGAFGDASILSGGDASPSVVRSYQDGAQSIGHIKTLPPNSRRPIPFETDIFQGSIILLLRPKPPERDGVYEERIFGRKKRNVEVQIQGQFKAKPEGEIYMGLELSSRMKMGLIAKGMCKMLLNFIKGFLQVHYSFGDSDDTELPHITFPMHKADRLVVSKPNETPPQLGFEVMETPDSVSQRKSGKTPVPDWNSVDIYTITYNSMYVNLVSWEICNLPIMRNVELTTFWGESSLRMVGYELPGDGEEKNRGKHVIKDLKYIFCIQMTRQTNGDHSLDESEISDQGEDNEDEDRRSALPWSRVKTSSSLNMTDFKALPRRDSGVSLVPSQEHSDSTHSSSWGEEENDDSSVYFDAVEQISSRNVGSAAAEQQAEHQLEFASQLPYYSEKTFEGRQPRLTDPDMCCLAWLDICSSSGKYFRLFAFTVEHERTIFRSRTEFLRHFGKFSWKLNDPVSSRLSVNELARRCMGGSLAALLDSPQEEHIQSLRNFALSGPERCYRSFLQNDRGIANSSSGRCNNDGIVPPMEGFVARAVSERHWIEQWATVSDSHINMSHPDRGKKIFRISLDGVIAVRPIASGEIPGFYDFSFLAIETLGRIIYLMQSNEERRDTWVKFLSKRVVEIRNGGRGPSQSIGMSPSIMIPDDPANDYLRKSSIWNCKNRRILNCRILTFAVGQKLGRNGEDAVEKVEASLRLALNLSDDCDEKRILEFLNGVAELKYLDISNLNDGERLVIFINVYHTMVMHAYAVVGTPKTKFQWGAFFNKVSYECFGDVFSLAELEHSIIRAGMSSPSHFLSKFIIPKSEYSFASKVDDFRINFALNCGSLNSPQMVPIYHISRLDDQLDQASRLYLRNSVNIKVRSRRLEVRLPRICKWYSADFGRGQPVDMIRLVLPFLDSRVSDEIKQSVKINEDPSSWGNRLSVKFSKYNFNCRSISLQE